MSTDQFTSTEQLHKTEAQSIADIAAKPEVVTVMDTPFLLVPTRYRTESLDYLLKTPSRKRGTIKAHDADSFIDFVKRHGSLNECNIYVDVDYDVFGVTAIAVLNDHADGDGLPGWGDHRVLFQPRFTPNWHNWIKNNGHKKDQVEFANFLEYHLTSISSPPESKLPTGAEVLTFVSQLQETRKVKYGSTIDLANGMKQIEFIEENADSTKGKLEIFREFAIAIRPFLNGQAYALHAYLRYRIDRNSGQISFWYDLQRPESVLEDACKMMVKSIREKTGMPVLFGEPIIRD